MQKKEVSGQTDLAQTELTEEVAIDCLDATMLCLAPIGEYTVLQLPVSPNSLFCQTPGGTEALELLA